MSPDGLLRAGTWGSRFVDLSHELADGMAPYPRLPTPRIGPHLDHAASRAHYDGEEFFLGKVDMPTNVGTYVDAPFHRSLHRSSVCGREPRSPFAHSPS
jgi:kynurenine formamidase